MKISSKVALVFIFDHPNLVVENFGRSICSALQLFDLQVYLISVSKDLNPQLSNINPNEVELIISIGPLSLGVQINGVSIFHFFKCPFYLYLIDSPIYDFARLPITMDFFNESLHDSRLKIGFAEKSYMFLFENYIKESNHIPNLHFLPFAAFPTHKSKRLDYSAKKVLVVGGLGTELNVSGTKSSTNLKDLIKLNDPYNMESSNIDLLIDGLI